MTDHPVKVPPELFTEWLQATMKEHGSKPGTVAGIVAARAAQWAADQELEACCDWIEFELRGQLRPAHRIAIDLRDARRPKSPSLAEQALRALGPSVGLKHFRTLSVAEQDDIRAALTRLAELEAQQ
jgi:hypothetical protein